MTGNFMHTVHNFISKYKVKMLNIQKLVDKPRKLRYPRDTEMKTITKFMR